MGVLNITPDSFYSGNQYLNNLNDISCKDLSFADIVDIGAESSRPGAQTVSEEEEILRLFKFNHHKLKNKILSIDSYKYNVIKHALENGFNLINDITAGGKDNCNIKLANEYNVPIVLMHMQGHPKSMQNRPTYKNLIDELMFFFDSKINYALKIGLPLNKIIIDPGIGFGKTKNDNFKIIKNLDQFKSLKVPIMIGVSRKSFLQLNDDIPSDRLEASLSVLSLAVFNGADIVRVHDVYKTHKVLNVIDRIKNQL